MNSCGHLLTVAKVGTKYVKGLMDSLRVVGHVVAKDENPFFFGWHARKHLVQAVRILKV